MDYMHFVFVNKMFLYCFQVLTSTVCCTLVFSIRSSNKFDKMATIIDSHCEIIKKPYLLKRSVDFYRQNVSFSNPTFPSESESFWCFSLTIFLFLWLRVEDRCSVLIVKCKLLKK